MVNETLRRLNHEIKVGEANAKARRILGEHQAADRLAAWLKVQRAARDRLREDARHRRQENFRRARRTGRRSTKA